MEHATRLTGVGLVFSARLAQTLVPACQDRCAARRRLRRSSSTSHRRSLPLAKQRREESLSDVCVVEHAGTPEGYLDEEEAQVNERRKDLGYILRLIGRPSIWSANRYRMRTP